LEQLVGVDALRLASRRHRDACRGLAKHDEIVGSSPS
jgi:hypothetical protein